MQNENSNLRPVKLEFPERGTQGSASSPVSPWNSQSPSNQPTENFLPRANAFQVAPGEIIALFPTAVALGGRRPRPQDHASCGERRHLPVKSAHITLPAHHPAHSLS